MSKANQTREVKKKRKYRLSISKHSTTQRYLQFLIKIYQTRNAKIYWSLLLSLMSIMFLIWAILLDVYYQQMFMPDSKDYKVIMSYMYVEQMNMEQRQKSKPLSKIKHQKKYVTFIIISIKMSMSGSISVLIILVGQARNGIRKFVNKSS